jgi:hypothetical protein
MSSLEQEWQAFVAAVFPPNLSKAQMIDLKRTFFGGAKAALNIMSDPSQAEEQTVSEVIAELWTFNEDVKAGRA